MFSIQEAEELLQLFDTDYAKELLKQIYYDILPHFIIYEKSGKNYNCYCTHCKKQYNEGPTNRSYKVGFYPEHNREGECVECGEKVTFKHKNIGRKGYLYKQNLAILKSVNGALTIKCVTVNQYFKKDEYNPQFFIEEKQRYYLSKDGNVRWKTDYCGGWRTIKTMSEPHFNNNSALYPADNSYIAVCEDELQKTHLKYCEIERYKNIHHSDGCRYVLYLCFLSKHPNVEYLMKTGYEMLVADLVAGKSGGLRLNYKTNDVKKMLGLNKEEFKELAGNDAEHVENYKFWRKHLLPNGSYLERIEYLQKYSCVPHKLHEIINITGLGFKQIINYVEKQRGLDSEEYTIGDWLDYLRQCRKLQYDLTQELIIKPKNLTKAHNRLTKLIKIKADEIMQKELEENNKKRLQLVYIDELRNLQVIVPETIQDIINEGKELSHCVGGYADRHAKGKLHILFLRKLDNPNEPFYTMEVDAKGLIVQCRGYMNNHVTEKLQYIEDFENEYQRYLNEVFNKKKARIKITA